jgi:hypothetical protein
MGPLALGSYRCNFVARAPSKHPEGRLGGGTPSGSAYMRHSPTTWGTILRDRSFQVVRVELQLKNPSSSPTQSHPPTLNLNRRFLSIHRLVPWAYFHLNPRAPDVPPSSFTLQTYQNCFTHLLLSYQHPIFTSRLFFRLDRFYSRLRYHISSTPRSRQSRHCQLSLWYLRPSLLRVPRPSPIRHKSPVPAVEIPTPSRSARPWWLVASTKHLPQFVLGPAPLF